MLLVKLKLNWIQLSNGTFAHPYSFIPTCDRQNQKGTNVFIFPCDLSPVGGCGEQRLGSIQKAILKMQQKKYGCRVWKTISGFKM